MTRSDLLIHRGFLVVPGFHLLDSKTCFVVFPELPDMVVRIGKLSIFPIFFPVHPSTQKRFILRLPNRLIDTRLNLST